MQTVSRYGPAIGQAGRVPPDWEEPYEEFRLGPARARAFMFFSAHQLYRLGRSACRMYPPSIYPDPSSATFLDLHRSASVQQANITIVIKRVQHGLGTRHPILNPILVRPVSKWLGPTVLVGLRHLHRFLRHGHAWCLYLSRSVCFALLFSSRHKLDNVDSTVSSALSGVQHIRVLEHKAPLTVYTVWDLESDCHVPRAGTLPCCSKAAGLRGMLAHRFAAGSLPSSCWLLRLL